MNIEILTKQDLQEFKVELLAEITKLLKLKVTNPHNKEWIKSYEVRKLLCISPGKLQTMRVNGTIAFTRIGGLIFYKHDDIIKMMEANKHQNPLSTRKEYLEKFDYGHNHKKGK